MAPDVIQAATMTAYDYEVQRWYWFAQIGLFVVAFVGIIAAILQIRAAHRARQDQNFVSILARTAEHNWKVFENRELRKAVEIFAKLNVPANPDDANLSGQRD